MIAQFTGQKLTSKVFNIESPPQNWLTCEAVEVFADGRQLKKATDLQVLHDVHLIVRKMHVRVRDTDRYIYSSRYRTTYSSRM